MIIDINGQEVEVESVDIETEYVPNDNDPTEIELSTADALQLLYMMEDSDK